MSSSADHAIEVLDQALASAPDPVLAAWRAVRGVVRSARRASATTQPHLAAISEQGLFVRHTLDEVAQGRLSPELRARVELALDYVDAMMAAAVPREP